MKLLSLTGILIYTLIAQGQVNPVPINWKRLADVRFTRKFNKQAEMYFMYPTFGNTVRQLDGKEIQIKGYLIPVDETGNIYVVSSQPMAMCFFCGGAGPESLIELQFRNKKQRFKTDEIRTLSGKLRLNPNDIEHLNYILTDAQIVAE